jgi:ubiquinone/menaquinone biosynthesis C-methylase UbiE
MTQASRDYLPAAGHDWALSLYDPFVKLLGGGRAIRALLEQADLRPGQRVLDIGCGTGTAAVMMKTLHPDLEVVGLDPDPKALARAQHKAQKADVSIQFDQGFGDALPYPDDSFDRVLSSFMFHHLPSGEKGNTLRAIQHALKTGGSFHMLDFEGPEHGSDGLLARMVHSSHRLEDNAESRVVGLMRDAGFANPAKIHRRKMLLGRIAYYRATK